MSLNNCQAKKCDRRGGERGAALAIAVIVVVILAVIAMTALAFSSTEARIAGSDLQRTHAFYAAAAGMEKMTNDFSNLFNRKMNPTADDLKTIENSPPEELDAENFKFKQTLTEDSARLNELRATQGLSNTVYPRVNIPDGPYAGLYASLVPYKMTSTALQQHSKAEVKLEREFNNYLIPLFQFGMFSNEDIELHPGPLMTFNGRVHSNRNIYALQNTIFLNRVTAAGEFVRDVWRNGKANDGGGANNVWVQVNGVNIQSLVGSGSVAAGAGTIGGPNIPGSTAGKRGFFPDSPTGVPNTKWEIDSVKNPLANAVNNFGGQVLTRTTGVAELKLPLAMGGSNSAEIIKRSLPSDGEILSQSRYHTKAEVRILIDDETAGSGAVNVAGISSGVMLSTFVPSVLNGGKDVLKLISDSGTVNNSGLDVKQVTTATGTTTDATTVRAVSLAGGTNPYVPPGAGIKGKILIEIVRPDGVAVDVTQEILSMGVTVGEPNGIVYLQRPLWAAFVQGSHDRAGNNFDLVSMTKNKAYFDGEINLPTLNGLAANRGYLSMPAAAADDDAGAFTRSMTPTGNNLIVPINVYNVREGWTQSTLSRDNLYTRGLMSVVEINVRNLTRWLDGVYDKNLLKNTKAVSTNIRDIEGYVVYVSDRRGDKSRTEYLSDGTAFLSTNGIVDNEDIYGLNGVLDAGEDVIDFGWNADGTSRKGTLQHKIDELPDSGTIPGITPLAAAPVADPTRLDRAKEALRTQVSYFRRSVRLFDGEKLSVSPSEPNKLSPTKGVTIATENPVYIWGNFNATGITGIPANGSTLNNGGFTGNQIPSSIVADAFFPLSKTWFDGSPVLYPEGVRGITIYRKADENLTSVSAATTVRAAIIAGTTISAMNGSPGRNANNDRINGGIHNYPRFLELWSAGGVDSPWNYTGSLVPLYRSTQAISQYEDSGANIYVPPRRNWSFDESFMTQQRLPPGTPFFQYVQATGFRQSLY